MAEDTAVVDPNAGHDTPNDGARPDAASGTPVTTARPTTASAPVDKAADERNRGILADLQKERRQRQQYEQQVAAITAERDQERRRVQALAGVNPQSSQDAEADEVRRQFGKLFPHLADLTAEDIKALRENRTSTARLEQANTQQWENHGHKMLESVVSAATKSWGGTLSDRQISRLKSAYVQEAENSQHDEDGNPVPGSFLHRHNRGDSTLIDEFIKNWNEDWMEPARRAVQAAANRQTRQVPSGRDRSVVGAGEKKIDVNDPKAVEDLLVAGFKERGGQFTR